MKIMWNKPLGGFGPSVTDYHVETRAIGEENWKLVDMDNKYLKRTAIENCSVTVQGLRQDLKHQFRITAINEAGESYASYPTVYWNKDTFLKGNLKISYYNSIPTK